MGQQRGEQELMTFEQRSTHILIQTVREIVIQILQSDVQLGGGRGILHARLE